MATTVLWEAARAGKGSGCGDGKEGCCNNMLRAGGCEPSTLNSGAPGEHRLPHLHERELHRGREHALGWRPIECVNDGRLHAIECCIVVRHLARIPGGRNERRRRNSTAPFWDAHQNVRSFSWDLNLHWQQVEGHQETSSKQRPLTARSWLKPDGIYEIEEALEKSAHFQVEVMEVAIMRSRVSGSSVYLSCRKPS